MSPKALKIALAASVAVNLFAIASGTTLYVALNREKAEAAEQKPPRDGSAMALIGQLDPEVRQRVRQALKESALKARPDFDEARQKRREAVDLAASDAYDVARATALLEESRAAEIRGRARLEADAAVILSTLDADDRRALSQILTRRGRVVVRDRPDPTDAAKK